MAQSAASFLFHSALYDHDHHASHGEYEDRVLRQESFVFLNVVCLAKILKPLFSHKFKEDNGDIIVDMDGERPIVLSTGDQKNSWRRLREKGILDLELANILWPNGLSDVVLPIVKKMDLEFPLGTDDTKLVVMQRLPCWHPKDVENTLYRFRKDNHPTLEGSWRLFRGVPPGVIENVLTRCCSLGDTHTFWRLGVLVKVHLDGNFALVLEFIDNEKLNIEVYGSPESVGPWMVLSFAMSVTLSKMIEFPGLKHEAKLRCPNDSGENLWISDQVR